MQLLLIAAVMSNQLWFDTQTEADVYIVRPMTTLSQNCTCQVSIAVSHRAEQGAEHQPPAGQYQPRREQNPLSRADAHRDAKRGLDPGDGHVNRWSGLKAGEANHCAK